MPHGAYDHRVHLVINCGHQTVDVHFIVSQYFFFEPVTPKNSMVLWKREETGYAAWNACLYHFNHVRYVSCLYFRATVLVILLSTAMRVWFMAITFSSKSGLPLLVYPVAACKEWPKCVEKAGTGEWRAILEEVPNAFQNSSGGIIPLLEQPVHTPGALNME